jgi:hypothetical protein
MFKVIQHIVDLPREIISPKDVTVIRDGVEHMI